MLKRVLQQEKTVLEIRMVHGEEREVMRANQEIHVVLKSNVGDDFLFVPKFEEWALDEMDRLGMNEYEYCNYKGYNIADIITEPDEEDDVIEEDEEDEYGAFY